MRFIRTILLTATFSLLLSACSVSNFIQPSNEVDNTNSPLRQLINKSLQNSPYTIISSTNDSDISAYSITIDTLRNIHIKKPTSSGTVEYIYSSNNQTFYKQAGEEIWLKLTISNSSIAKDLLNYNVLLWSDEQLSSGKAEIVSEPKCDSCTQYQVSSNTLSLIITIDQDSELITTSNFNHENIDYIFEYKYDGSDIVIPENYQEYSIPSDPSKSDIESIQEIYGTN